MTASPTPSAPGLPSAHPAAYRPVTLVGDAFGKPVTPPSPDLAGHPAALPPDPRPDRSPASRSDAPPVPWSGLPPAPRRPLDADLGPGPSRPAPVAPGPWPVPHPGVAGPWVGPGPPNYSSVRIGPGPVYPGPVYPAPAGVPAYLAAPLNQPTRPGTVTAAGVLWMLTAGVELLFAVAAFATGGLPVFLPVLALVSGIATAVLTVVMLRGSDAARIAVTVLGGCAGSVVLLPLVLFVPAAIVTLHPSSTAWFTDTRRRRQALAHV